MSEQEEYSPYCPVCTACGEEGCCSPMGCSQDPNGDYCKGYLKDLKHGYAMNEWVQKNLLNEELIPKELKRMDIHNLYRVELSRYWRALYTIEGNNVEILLFILKMCDHKEYDKLFGYRKK